MRARVVILVLSIVAGASVLWVDRSVAKMSPIQDDVIRVANALALGASHADRDTLGKAARTLDALGAHPADDHDPDLARLWAAAAYRGKAAPPPFRGRILGPGYVAGAVAAGGRVATEQLFLGGQSAHVAVSTATSAKLSLTIRNGSGDTVCAIPNNSANTACHWVAIFSERYRIEVSNPSAQSAKYFLVTN